MSTESSVETHGFQTEARQLLKLMIHSLYSNREIFLRELISNASDAIDKLRFKAISQPDLAGSDNDFAIKIDFDADAKTLTVSDNGIGMTRAEVIDNLGTIARSGTAEFMNSLTGDQKQDTALIGQFGVGFYSVFIVADEVEVFTRGAATQAGTRWVSKGEDQFTVEDAETDRGTRIVLHLRSDAQEFAEGYRLRNIVTKYSDHIGTPVKMRKPDDSSDEDESTDKGVVEPVWET
ncbi:MAG: ATP-binding protein, partial [Proteobacteria bacterium]|nr:ATP-binding protein [Pseudomonadota bacterium]